MIMVETMFDIVLSTCVINSFQFGGRFGLVATVHITGTCSRPTAAAAAGFIYSNNLIRVLHSLGHHVFEHPSAEEASWYDLGTGAC